MGTNASSSHSRTRGWAITATSSAYWASCPQEAELVALCDQDDRWHHDKLETLREAMGPEIALAYCDMNLVDESGKLLSPTYWTERHTNHKNMTSLMVANTITAAASLFPRRLLDYALPFPAQLGRAFHDHWLALVALASGRIAYVDRSLYDYVQHSTNAFGFRGASWKQRRRAGRRRRAPGASDVCCRPVPG